MRCDPLNFSTLANTKKKKKTSAAANFYAAGGSPAEKATDFGTTFAVIEDGRPSSSAADSFSRRNFLWVFGKT
jgi:hypothetical protein